MSSVVFQKPELLNLLWVIPPLVAVFLYATFQRRKAIQSFIAAGLLNRIKLSVSPTRRLLKAALILLSLACVALALGRPGWNPKPKRLQSQGRDVVFLLDVSKSMLAEDLAPNRLERAKLMITDCVEQLQGDRVALIAFAGSAVVKCPPTLDYGFLRFMLEDVSTDSIGRGGTMIGDVIRKASSALLKENSGRHTDFILITDGGDQGSFPLEAARAAGERGVRIIVIGLGDEKDGSRIPLPEEKKPPPLLRGGGYMGLTRRNEAPLLASARAPGRRNFLLHHGQEVWSKLDSEVLREVAAATPGGMYFSVGMGAIDLGAVYHQVSVAAERKELESPSATEYDEAFQGFLAVAFVALALEFILTERRRIRCPV